MSKWGLNRGLAHRSNWAQRRRDRENSLIHQQAITDMRAQENAARS